MAPALTCVGVRGNVDTRLRKLAEGTWDALILAEASLDRLGITQVRRYRLNSHWFIPCAAQGALALEMPANHHQAAVVAKLACPVTTQAVRAERSVLARLGGDCTMPFGCLVERRQDGSWHGQAAIYGANGEFAQAVVSTSADGFDAESFATALFDQLKIKGAAKVLRSLGISIPAEMV